MSFMSQEAVLANETVQQGLSLLGSWGRAFTDSVSDLVRCSLLFC